MKYLYKGTIYEADYHNRPTSHFNLDFIGQIHTIAEMVGSELFHYMRSKEFKVDQIVKLIENPSIYVTVTNKTQWEGADAEMSEFKDGYLIKVPVKNVPGGNVGNDMFIHLLHEVTHILQREHGIKSDIDHLHLDGNLNPNVYFNDPTEVDAFLMSIIAYSTYSSNRARILSKIPFDQFVRTVLGYLKAPKSFVDYMASGKKSNSKYDDGDNTHDSTRNTFYEILHYLHAKLKQGYFTPLKRMAA